MSVDMRMLNRVYEEYLGTLGTNLARGQAKKVLDKDAGTSDELKSKGVVDIKGVIYFLLLQDGYKLWSEMDDKQKETYFIRRGERKVLPLNKTSYLFARYITNNILRKEKHTEISLYRILVGNTGFGSPEELRKYLTGLLSGDTSLVNVTVAQSNSGFKFDIFDTPVDKDKWMIVADMGELTYGLKSIDLNGITNDQLQNYIDESFKQAHMRFRAFLMGG